MLCRPLCSRRRSPPDLIGERGREVGDFVRGALGAEGLRRSVVVAATSDAPPLVRVRGALRATAIAEYFRAQGKSVLLVMDSVTRFAMALREASLAAGEPPLTKGYTPTVFAAHSTPRRPARARSITAMYTVLVEGDDLQDPIADATRGILDGHIVLSRKLADGGLFPAIDVLRSVSRVANEVTTREHRKGAARVRDMMATYAEASDLIQIGAYVAGTDPRIDAARVAHPRIEALIRQELTEGVPREASIQALGAITGPLEPGPEASGGAHRRRAPARSTSRRRARDAHHRTREANEAAERARSALMDRMASRSPGGAPGTTWRSSVAAMSMLAKNGDQLAAEGAAALAAEERTCQGPHREAEHRKSGSGETGRIEAARGGRTMEQGWLPRSWHRISRPRERLRGAGSR